MLIIIVMILSLPVLAWFVGCRLKAMREAENTNNTGHTGLTIHPVDCSVDCQFSDRT